MQGVHLSHCRHILHAILDALDNGLGAISQGRSGEFNSHGSIEVLAPHGL